MPRLYRVLACASLCFLPACASYRTQTVSPALQGKTVRVSVTDPVTRSKTVKVRDFWVRSDSVGGTACERAKSTQPDCNAWTAWSAPESAVVRIETLRLNLVQTTLAVSVVTLGFLFVAGRGVSQ